MAGVGDALRVGSGDRKRWGEGGRSGRGRDECAPDALDTSRCYSGVARDSAQLAAHHGRLSGISTLAVSSLLSLE